MSRSVCLACLSIYMPVYEYVVTFQLLCIYPPALRQWYCVRGDNITDKGCFGERCGRQGIVATCRSGVVPRSSRGKPQAMKRLFKPVIRGKYIPDTRTHLSSNARIRTRSANGRFHVPAETRGTIKLVCSVEPEVCMSLVVGWYIPVLVGGITTSSRY